MRNSCRSNNFRISKEEKLKIYKLALNYLTDPSLNYLTDPCHTICLCPCIQYAIRDTLPYNRHYITYYHSYSGYITKSRFPEFFKFKPKDVRNVNSYWFEGRIQRILIMRKVIKLCEENNKV